MSATFSPDTIVLAVRFQPITTKESANVQNDTRRCLMGLEKASHPIVKEVKKRVGVDVLTPYSFALIKEPMKRGGRLVANVATGAVAIYFYTGPWDKLEDSCTALKDVCSEIIEAVKSMRWSSFEIYVAKGLSHE